MGWSKTTDKTGQLWTSESQPSASGNENVWYVGGLNAKSKKKRSKVNWSSDYTAEGSNTPEWWQGLTPSRVSGTTAYLSMMNAMIPYMSPEDQLTTLNYLSLAYPDSDIGKAYAPAAAVETNNIPTEISSATSQYFTSAERAAQAKQALETLVSSISSKSGKREAAVKKSLGAGYEYLTNVLNTIEKFSGAGNGENQTRAQYEQLASQLEPILALGDTDKYSAYKSLAQQIAAPYFSAGSVTPTSKVNGEVRYGASNPKFY